MGDQENDCMKRRKNSIQFSVLGLCLSHIFIWEETEVNKVLVLFNIKEYYI